MDIQKRLLRFVSISNWLLLFGGAAGCLLWARQDVAAGVICGGLIVTVNFHLLYRTLRRSLTPPHLASHHIVLAQYYLRFFISGLIIFLLISNRLVNPVGLFAGLSVVVVSISIAALLEFKHLIFKEAV